MQGAAPAEGAVVLGGIEKVVDSTMEHATTFNRRGTGRQPQVLSATLHDVGTNGGQWEPVQWPELDADDMAIGALKVSAVIAAVQVLSTRSVAIQRLLALGKHVFSCRAQAAQAAAQVAVPAHGGEAIFTHPHIIIFHEESLHVRKYMCTCTGA